MTEVRLSLAPVNDTAWPSGTRSGLRCPETPSSGVQELTIMFKPAVAVIEADQLERLFEEASLRGANHALAKYPDLKELTEELYMLKTWLTMREAARYLGVKPDTVSGYISQGLPCSRPGKSPMIKREDLDRWIEERRVR